MFRQILSSQWKWTAPWTVVLTIAGFAAPVWIIQRAGLINPTEWDVVRMLSQVRAIGLIVPVLALIAGAAVAAAAWAADQRGQHVYALTLPLPRWYYALLRLAAGLILLAPIIAGLALGAVAATRLATLPEGLTAYAGALTLRFALCALVTYAAVFALVAAGKSAQRIVLGVIVGFVGLQVMLVLLGLNVDVLSATLLRLFEWPGPFQLFAGPWMLIDL